MITLAPSIAAFLIAGLAFIAYVMDLNERAAHRRALEEQATAETKAKAIRAEVADALESLAGRVKHLEGEVLTEDDA